MRRVDPTRLATLALVAVLGFAVAFAIARAVPQNDRPASPNVERVAVPLIKIANLDRAPTMKPLRSAAGSTTTPTGP